MANMCILIFMGLPATGKSSMAKAWKDWLSKHNMQCIRVSYDDVLPESIEKVLLETGNREKSAWRTYRRNILSYVEVSICKLLKQTHHSEQSQTTPNQLQLFEKHVGSQINFDIEGQSYIFLIDDNMYYRSMRYQYYQLARKYNTGFAQVYFDCDLAEVSLRNKDRPQRVTDLVISQMSSKIEPPDLKLDSWEKYSTRIRSSNSESDSPLSILLDLAIACMADPVQPMQSGDGKREESRTICSSNLIHQADQIVRAIIQTRITCMKESNCSVEVLRENAKELNKTKAVLLKRIRDGSIIVPVSLITFLASSSKDATNPVFQFIQHTFNDVLYDDNSR